jgi:hypothetical protein
MPEELVPVLNRVKELARGGLTSMMVLGDFLKRRIAPLQQRTRMAYMYTGSNECCRIARGPSTDFTRAELEVAIRGMTGDTFSPESLVLPSGVKALCEDQTLWSSVLASMPTLDEGGLAVRQLGGDPNRRIHIPGASPNRQQRASQGPGGHVPEVRPPSGRGKIRCRCRSTATRTTWVPPRPGGATRRRGQPPRGAAKQRGPSPGGSSAATAPSSGSRPPNARRRRRPRGKAGLHHLRHSASSQRGDRRKRGVFLRSSRFLRRHRCRSAQ